jgi:hypothetical protein
MNINIETFNKKINIKKLLKIKFMMEDYLMKKLNNSILLLIETIHKPESKIYMEKNQNSILGNNI